MSKTITDCFAKYIGTREYDGIVADIQRWYYGYVYKASWCATSTSYFANELGLLNAIGGKNENVYRMMEACRATGKGTFYYRKDIPKNYIVRRGTLLFLLHSGTTMTTTSSKHVTTAYEDFTFTGSGNIKCLGGNQNDSICIAQYTQAKIYAIFVPPYPEDKPKGHTTLRKTSPTMKGDEVRELQSALNKLGFGPITGEELEVDGSYGSITMRHVTAFQVINNLVADGICGPITWAKIDELLALEPVSMTATTDVYYRLGPGKNYKALGMVYEGEKVTFTTVTPDGWGYVPAKGGWSSLKIYN